MPRGGFLLPVWLLPSGTGPRRWNMSLLGTEGSAAFVTFVAKQAQNRPGRLEDAQGAARTGALAL